MGLVTRSYPSPTPHAEEVAEEIERILSSDRFKISDPLRNLLIFLAKRAAENPGVPVKEYELAVEVLKRNGDFDARLDAGVRAVASRLRSKLAEYYVHEGAGDAIVVDIPKGHYLLSSIYRGAPGPPSDGGVVPPETAPARDRRWLMAFAIVVVAVGIAAYVAGRASALPRIPAASRQFWGDFLDSVYGPTVVYSNPAFVYSPQAGMQLVDSRAAGQHLIDAYTGTGEVIAVSDLTRQFLLFGKPARVKRALLFTWDEVLANDLIFVGSQDQNLPVGQLPRLEKLNFQKTEEESAPTAVVVRNEMPRPGEKALYLPTGDLDEGVDYAILALTQGVSPERRVLILAGGGTYGTQAAAEFVCNPVRLRELLGRLQLRPGSPVPPFEALLEVQIRGGVPSEARLVLVYRAPLTGPINSLLSIRTLVRHWIRSDDIERIMVRSISPDIKSRRLPTVCYCLALALSPFATPTLLPQTAADRHREIQAHVQKAQEALNSRNTAAAEAEFRAVLILDPKNTDARANLGVLRFFRADWAGAADQFRQVLKAQPSLWKAQALLGICEKRLGHAGEAQHLLEESLPHLKDGALRLQAGLELVEIPYRSGDLERAAEIVGVLERANPTNIDVLYTAYRIHADLANRARDALALIAPDSSRMHEIMAQHMVNEGDLLGAIAQYRKVLAIDPRLRGVHHELAEAILKDSRSDAALDEAQEQFRAALAENPGDAGAEYGLGRVCARRMDFKSAIQHYGHALALRPDHVYAQIGMGEALMEMDESQKALEHLLAASRLDPLNATVHYRLASIYRKLGREPDGRSEVEAFKRLRESKKQIEHVYQEMHQVVPEEDAIPSDTPKQ